MQAGRASRSLISLAFASMLASVAGCWGQDQIPIGIFESRSLFISPTGTDQDPGTRERPLGTFRAAIPRLPPGGTLVLLDGTYSAANSGYLDIRCGANAANGELNQPITVRADHERAALLQGDASGPPFLMEHCSHWVVEGLRAESGDFQSAPSTKDSGSVFLLAADDHNVVLKRLIASKPNRYRHSHGVRIGDGSSDVLVEECEVYDFHHNGFEASRTRAVTFRRNYANARERADLPGGFVTHDPTRGDFAFFLTESQLSVVENNIAESVQDGFGVEGRDQLMAANMPPPTSDPTDGIRLFGNVAVAPSRSGFSLGSTCTPPGPCVDRARLVIGTELTDDVVVGGVTGIASAGAIGTRISQFTAIGAATGVALTTTAANIGLAATSRTDNSLAVGFTTAGFTSAREQDWGFDHCAAIATGAAPAYLPDDGHVTSRVTTDPALGDCLVFLPPASPLRTAGAGGHQVGARVAGRYQDGLLTATPLWNSTSGAFPCGAQIPTVNDDPNSSCQGVHRRLHVGTGTCALP